MSLCRGAEPRHTVVRLSVCHYAEGGATEVYCNRGVCQSVCQSVCLLQVFLVAHWKLSAETSNTSRYRYLLGFVLKKIGFKASFASYGVICLPWLPWLAIWTLLKTKVPTFDCLEARSVLQDSMVGPEKSRQRAMAKPTAISLACWFCSHAQLINICLASVFESAWLLLSSLYVVRASMYAS